MRSGQTCSFPMAASPPPGRVAQLRLFPGSATTVWEAVIARTLTPGDRVLVLDAGPLSTLWADIADRLGLVVETVGPGTSEAGLARHLGADRFGRIKAVFIVQTEAEGRAPTDIASLRRALDSAFHDALLFVDASMSADPGPLDARCADIVVADAQAGLARLARPVPATAKAITPRRPHAVE